jgi:L-ascorbate metabolism protein UlaG (beta-lactamase superfamily)
MKYIHMFPQEVLQAAKDQQAKRLFPVHSSKFDLGKHPWYEPLATISALSQTEDINLITPIIGELVDLDNTNQTFTRWWESVK